MSYNISSPVEKTSDMPNKIHTSRVNQSPIPKLQYAQQYHLFAAAILFMLAPTITTSFTIKQSTRMGRHLGVPPSRIIKFHASQSQPRYLLGAAGASDDNDDEDNDEEMPPPVIDGFGVDSDIDLTRDELISMTVAQIKQQLRLRGKKVTGNKAQLVERLLEKNTGNDYIANDEVVLQPGYSKYDKPNASPKKTENTDDSNTAKDVSKRVAEAKARGADIADVTEFIEVEEVGKEFRSSNRKRVIDYEPKYGNANGTDASEENGESYSSPEVWGEDARIVDDYEGRSVVVDGLSRTVIEYKGSNSTIVQAYVVGSRDSLKNFLKGGQAAQKSQNDTKTNSQVYSSMEEEVYAIQRKREMESKRGLIRPDEVEGQEDEHDQGTPYSTIERDEGDWGVYTPTGAQMSSSEVQGVLLLSDVFGPFTDNTQALADKIAFECQPVVVLVPDLFRGKPWTLKAVVDEDGVERNKDGKSYEEWRAMHQERRVDVDIRAAAAVLRERYAVSSIAVWGTCYGGGRALEAAAGWYAGGAESYYEDAFSDRPAPPHVDPIACVAWYPTRYDARKLFGKNNEGFRTFESGKDRSCAIMAVFAEDDALPGATPDDAMLLKECLDEDPRVKDSMVKIFPDQKHGFAHANLGMERETNGNEQDEMDRFLSEDFGSMESMAVGGDAEVACLLSTAWMETYTRVFLPTAGSPVRFDADERWSSLGMDGYSEKEKREMRAELEEAIAKYEDVDIDMSRMSQSASPLLDGPGSEAFDRIEEEREKMRQAILEKYNITDDDDEATLDAKIMKAIGDGAFKELTIDAYEDGDAYW